MNDLRHVTICLMLGFCLICCGSERALAASSEKTPSSSDPAKISGENDDETAETPTTDAEDQQQDIQRRKLEIGMILTSGIFILGIFLVVITMIYGRRTRRKIAAGRGPSEVRDELWYLKNARDSSTDSDHPEEEKS